MSGLTFIEEAIQVEEDAGKGGHLLLIFEELSQVVSTGVHDRWAGVVVRDGVVVLVMVGTGVWLLLRLLLLLLKLLLVLQV